MAGIDVTESPTGNYNPDMFSPLQFCEVVDEGQQNHQLHQSSERTIANPSPLSQNQQCISQTHTGSQLVMEQASVLQIENSNLAAQNMRTSSQPATRLKSIPMSSPLLIVTNGSSQGATLEHSNLPPCQSHDNQTQSLMPLPNNTHIINCNGNQTNATENKIESVENINKLNSIGTNSMNELKDSSELVIKPEHVTQGGDKLPVMSHLSSLSSIEYILTTPLSNVQIQSTNQSVVNIQQPFYQMQLSRQPQDGQALSFSTVHVQGQNPTLAITSQNGLAIPTVVGLQAITPDRFTINSGNQTTALNISPTTTAVATQTTQVDTRAMDGDEPEILYSTPINKTPNYNSVASAPSATKVPEVPKIIPIKKTWRRPWKKKKEREKKQAVKKNRRLKRRRIVLPKKNSVYIDPRNGPPVDTNKTVVQRIPEEHVPEPKQKRHRIKLNRNSGREYINRLGKTVCARKIGSPCNCPLKCWDRMGSKVLDIFNNFWDLCDFNLQNSYLFTCLKLCDVKRRYTKKQPAEESRRQNTFEYFVRINGKHFRVCKKAFMSAHGLTSDKRLRTLFTQMKDGALVPEPDRRGKHFRPNKTVNGLTVLGSSEISNTSKTHAKVKSKKSKKKQTHARAESHKQAMYPPQHHSIGHIQHCAPVSTTHGAMQEPQHAYIPNGELYFPGHYLDAPQPMAPTHMNQIPQCQKMLDTPAYFMAGMKENTFHQ